MLTSSATGISNQAIPVSSPVSQIQPQRQPLVSPQNCVSVRTQAGSLTQEKYEYKVKIFNAKKKANLWCASYIVVMEGLCLSMKLKKRLVTSMGKKSRM